MMTTDEWLFELTNRVSASSGLTESDKHARIEHLRLAFASLVDFDVHMAQQQQAKRYAEIWHTNERPDWIDPPEKLWHMVNRVVDNLKYIEDIAISQLLGPIKGLSDLNENLRDMPIDDAIDNVRTFSAAYVQSLYDTHNDPTQHQDLSDVLESPDDAHKPVQMPTTNPRPYEQLMCDVNASIDEMLSQRPEAMPTTPQSTSRDNRPHLQPNAQVDLEANPQYQPQAQANPQPEVETNGGNGGLMIDDFLEGYLDDPNEYAIYGTTYASDYVEDVQQGLDPYGDPISISDDWGNPEDDEPEAIGNEDGSYDMGYNENLDDFGSHYADPHLSSSREDELIDDIESDDDDDT